MKKTAHRCGTIFCFHGLFTKKSKAEGKASKVAGSFVKFVTGRRRSGYLVVTRKRKK